MVENESKNKPKLIMSDFLFNFQNSKSGAPKTATLGDFWNTLSVVQNSRPDVRNTFSFMLVKNKIIMELHYTNKTKPHVQGFTDCYFC